MLEPGAGCGLLGLSVVAVYPGVRVTLSDFPGHFEGSDGGSVLHNLRWSAGSVRVVQLDWPRPSEPQLWFASDEETGGAAEPRPCTIESVDVALATEVLYTEEGTRHFVGTVAALLRKSGALFLMNNARRTGVAKFEGACAAVGLRVERLPDPGEEAAGVMSTFCTAVGR